MINLAEVARMPEPAAPDRDNVHDKLLRAACDQAGDEIVLKVEVARGPDPLSPSRRAARDAAMTALAARLLGPPPDSP